jgi:hypothetical protein
MTAILPWTRHSEVGRNNRSAVPAGVFRGLPDGMAARYDSTGYFIEPTDFRYPYMEEASSVTKRERILPATTPLPRRSR